MAALLSIVFIALLLFSLHVSPSPVRRFHRLFLYTNNAWPHSNELYDLDIQELSLVSPDGAAVSSTKQLDTSPSQASDALMSAPFSPSSLSLSSSSSCDATYGVMPCTDSIIGSLFLVAVYGFLLFLAAKMMSDGSELLLTVLDAGLIGGLLLPILGALPDSLLILVSGLGGSKSEAQQQVLVGIGLLAGSVVMLLTLLWGSCLIVGRCDLELDGSEKVKAVDKRLTKSFDLTGTGVEVDNLTQLAARIMIISVVPYIVAQLPKIFGFSTNGNIPVLVACILSLAGLLTYCLYQAFTPWLQQRRKEIARQSILKVIAMENFVKHTGGQKLVDDRGTLDESYAERLFKQIDRNGDGMVTHDELGAMLSVSLTGRHGGTGDIVGRIMEEFDVDKNANISWDEFLKGMRNWCSELKLKEKPIEHYRRNAEKSLVELEDSNDENNGDDDGASKDSPTRKQLIRRAVLLLLGGTIIAAVFADPLVDAVDAFSFASNIPSFFVSFVLLPLASNSSEGVSSLMFAARKKKKNASLTYSQIYGAVTMNSTMGLGIFLAVVYARQLVWDFSSEVLVICVVTIIMGAIGSLRQVYPLWMAGVALLLYPLSLGLVAVLDYVAGWQ